MRTASVVGRHQKMRSLIELKYITIGDVVAELGTPASIGETFVGFQKHLYER